MNTKTRWEIQDFKHSIVAVECNLKANLVNTSEHSSSELGHGTTDGTLHTARTITPAILTIDSILIKIREQQLLTSSTHMAGRVQMHSQEFMIYKIDQSARNF
jgi:hypothetical protein